MSRDRDRVWSALLDVPRVAAALGATVGEQTEAGVWRGTVRLGTAEYAGSVRLQEVDEDERVAVYRVEGHEAGGPGSAAATITARSAEGRLAVATELQATGRPLTDPGDLGARLERELGRAGRRRRALAAAAVVAPAAAFAGVAIARAVRRR